MKIATIYTLYGRRAGAELCFEKTLSSIYAADNKIGWIVFCNRQAKEILDREFPYVKAVYVGFLDNQYKKAFWLEFLAKSVVDGCGADCFWIPSGCNHFPGKWKIPTLTTFHDLGEYHIENKYSFARMVFRKKICIPRSVKRSKHFTCVSKFTARDMDSFLGLKRSQISLVYNGCSPHKTFANLNGESILKKWGLEKNQYFFTPGRTDYVGKGLDVLFSAFNSFQKTNEQSGLKLVLVGPRGEGYEMFEADLKNTKNAMYLGRVTDEELAVLYANSLATVISSRFEGFGFPVLEAMEYDSIVISSDAGALPEVLGDAALVFESGNDDALLQQMNRVLTLTPNWKQVLKERGKARLSVFDWKKCAVEMIESFEKVLG